MNTHPQTRAVLTAIFLCASLTAFGQGPGGRGGRGGAPQTPQQSAPFDITGKWISVVTEDWMFRMVTPPKGQYLGVPINNAARRIADAWDPAADQAAGQSCKGYGAGAIMRRPGRLRISWSAPNELKIEAEAGEQVRLFPFTSGVDPDSAIDLLRVSRQASSSTQPNWQGNSAALWRMQNAQDGKPRRGTLEVVTTGAAPGYLRKNGVPYSADAIVTEYFDSYTASNGDVWLVVTTSVHDPEYLTTDFITSSHFKKLPAGDTAWIPEPCSAE